MARSHGHASVTPEEVALGIGEQVSGVELWVDTVDISGLVAPRVTPKARSRACWSAPTRPHHELRAPSCGTTLYCMTDSNVVPFPKDQRDTQWWEFTPVLVRWDVRREPNVPVITAVGTILVERDEPLDDGATDDDYHEKAGEIRIAKAFVDTTDIVLAMDGLTSDHEFLASQIIDGTFYEEEFADWFDDEFGVILTGDPVFVLDLVIDEKHRDPDCLVAAHAALDALSTFGGVASPLVTFHLEGVDPKLRSGLREVGLWGWVHALRAKRWKGAYVTSRP